MLGDSSFELKSFELLVISRTETGMYCQKMVLCDWKMGPLKMMFIFEHFGEDQSCMHIF